MATHSSTLAWKTPWTEEPGGLQSMGSLRVRHDRATSLSLFTFMHWRRKWQPTSVFLPGESQGQGSLMGCHLWDRTVGHDWSDLAAAASVRSRALKPNPTCPEFSESSCGFISINVSLWWRAGCRPSGSSDSCCRSWKSWWSERFYNLADHYSQWRIF